MATKRPPLKPRKLRTEHELRLGGAPGRIGQQQRGIRWAGAYRNLMVRLGQTGNRSKSRRVSRTRDRNYHQMVAVRVRYSLRAAPGQWKAHGRYIAREGAAKQTKGMDAGFDGAASRLSPSAKLNSWEEAGDELIWKIIISPERGSEMDMMQFTRELVALMESDTNLRLEWTAVVHTNTDHHHVHLVIRGVDLDGKEVKFQRDYIKQGIRGRAREIATAKLGHRLEYDVIEAQTRMVDQPRLTDLDRGILGGVVDGVAYLNPIQFTGVKAATEACCVQRALYLERIGLATRAGEHSWTINDRLESTLRALGKAHDYQRTMDQHGVLASDPATPVQVTSWREIDSLEGRILVHGQEDQAERAYMMIEDVNGVIRHMEHRKEIVALRHAGQLQPGSYVAMRVKFVGPEARWIVEDHGPADAALQDDAFLAGCTARGVDPQHELGGWLGAFQGAIRGARSRRGPSRGRSQGRKV